MNISYGRANLFAIRTLDQNEGAIVAAVKWVVDGLLGPAAISIAVVAVGGIGLAMLLGRFDLRLAGRTVLGIFIIFGAPVIAYEITQSSTARQTALDVAITVNAPAAPTMPKNAPVNDPYAGAAVPQLQ